MERKAPKILGGLQAKLSLSIWNVCKYSHFLCSVCNNNCYK